MLHLFVCFAADCRCNELIPTNRSNCVRHGRVHPTISFLLNTFDCVRDISDTKTGIAMHSRSHVGLRGSLLRLMYSFVCIRRVHLFACVTACCRCNVLAPANRWKCVRHAQACHLFSFLLGRFVLYLCRSLAITMAATTPDTTSAAAGAAIAHMTAQDAPPGAYIDVCYLSYLRSIPNTRDAVPSAPVDVSYRTGDDGALQQLLGSKDKIVEAVDAMNELDATSCRFVDEAVSLIDDVVGSIDVAGSLVHGHGRNPRMLEFVKAVENVAETIRAKQWRELGSQLRRTSSILIS